jgi:hypothetical protein
MPRTDAAGTSRSAGEEVESIGVAVDRRLALSPLAGRRVTEGAGGVASPEVA